MRIAIVSAPFIPVPPKQYGGSEQVIHYLIKGLKERGHKPILLAPADSTEDCIVIPTTEHSIGLAKTHADRPTIEAKQRAIDKKTSEILRGLLPSIDIIHSHNFDLKEFAGFPNVTTLHCKAEFETYDFYKQRKNQHFVSVSRNQREAYPKLKYAGVVYNGEDPKNFPYVDDPEDYVCFLGRFDREKNPHIAIQLALAMGIKIKLAGKIDYLGEGYFEEEVAKYFDHPLVEYLGELGFEDKVRLLANAKCNLHPVSFREPFGLTVIEAAYCGTPTLAVNRGSMPELIEDGRTGMLVEDFVEGLKALKQCFEMDRAYVANRARQLFNYQTMTEGYLKAYRKVLVAHGVYRSAEVLRRTMSGEKLSRLPRLWGTRKTASTF